MTTRIQQILIDARFKLGDVSKERWSDDRLLRLVSAAQADIAKQTKILKRTFTIVLQEGQRTYELPDDVWLILRATYNGSPLALVTYDEMDDFVTASQTRTLGKEPYTGMTYTGTAARYGWDNDTGTYPTALIYDNRDMDTIRVYPEPKELSDVAYVFAKDAPPEFEGDELTGIVAEITGYTNNSDYGILVDLYDPLIDAEMFNSPFGVVSQIGETDKVITVWCTRVPTDLKTVHDNLELGRIYDDAMMHYVVGHAFDDDVDERSLAKSNKAFKMYDRELKIPASTSSRDGVNSPKTPTSTYRGPFNAN